MSLTTEECLQGGWLVLGVAGDLDICTAPELRADLLDALSRAADHRGRAPHGVVVDGAPPALGLVVDLSAVSFMDSAGLGVLVGLYKRAMADRTDLRLAGATEQVTKLFAITGLDRVFAMRASVQEAVLRPTGS